MVGRHFLKYSAELNLKRIILECGGKSPRKLAKLQVQLSNPTFARLTTLGLICRHLRHAKGLRSATQSQAASGGRAICGPAGGRSWAYTRGGGCCEGTQAFKKPGKPGRLTRR